MKRLSAVRFKAEALKPEGQILEPESETRSTVYQFAA